MKKALILIATENRYFWNYIQKNTKDYDIWIAYKKYLYAPPKKFLVKHRELNFLKIGILGNWKNHIKQYDKVIMFDSSFSNQLGKKLSKYKFERGVFFIYWNYSDRNQEKMELQLGAIDEYISKYSFNLTDCEKYHLLYNPTFYEPYDLEKLGNVSIKYDIIFSGYLKNDRFERLDDFLTSIEKKKYRLMIDVWGKKEGKKTERFEIKDTATPYMEYLKLIAESRVMLDIATVIEKGLSLRALEAMFYKKKLITNDPYIKHEKFYSPNNIFIIGMDDIEKLDEFIDGNFDESVLKELDEYRIQPWIDRFV